MNEIIKHHNELNDFELGKLSPNQANLFTYLVYKIKDKDKVVISYDEAMEKLDLPKEHRYFKKLLLQSYNKIMDMKYYNIKINENGNTSGSISHIFDEFEWDDETELISLEVNQKNKYLFAELQNRFTQYSLAEFIEIEGSHAKTLYRILKQWRYTGETPVMTIEKFKFVFGLTEKYKLSDIDRRVLNPAIDELKKLFIGLEVHKKYEKRKNKGRPKLEGYWFSFKAEQKEKAQAVQPTQESIAKVTSWEKTNRYCPRCHRAIYKKQLENENGTYYLYGHTDFKTGDCSYTTYDFADLTEKHQLPNDEPLTEKQKENKRKFSNIISNLFK
jgi:plasmid replication initiation protein